MDNEYDFLNNNNLDNAYSQLMGQKQQIGDALRSKLSPDKIAKIKQITDDPVAWALAPSDVKIAIGLMKEFAPDLFLTEEQKLAPLKKGQWYGIGHEPIQKLPEVAAQQSAQTVAQRAAYGDIISTPTYEKFVKYGILPEIKGKNFWGVVTSTPKFAWQKGSSVSGAYGRQLAAVKTVENKYNQYISPRQFENLPVVEKIKLATNPANNFFAVKATEGKIEIPVPLTKKETKETGKAFWQATINKKGSPYENRYVADVYKEMYPAFSQEIPALKAYTENTPMQRLKGHYGFDWLTKKWAWAIPPATIVKTLEAVSVMGANILKTPADAAGFLTEVLADPSTYLSAGLGKGARTALKVSADIVSEGKIILPEGAELGLSLAGRVKINPLVEEAADDMMKFMIENQAKGLLKFPAIENPLYAKALKTNIIKKISEPIIRETASRLPYREAIKLFDFGGLKFAGETVIPGYKFGKVSNIIKSSTAANLKDNKVKQFVANLINKWQEAFVPSAKYPSEIYPHYQAIESAAKARVTEAATLIRKLIKDNRLSKADFPVVADYLGYSKDISDINKKVILLEDKLNLATDIAERQNLFKAIEKQVSEAERLKGLLPDLSDKPNLIKFVSDYQSEFLNKFLYQPEKAFGIGYIPKDIYYPPRIEKIAKGYIPDVKEIGPTTAKFQFAQQTPYWKLKELENTGKIKMKGFLETNYTRALESATALSRKELTGVIRTVSKFKPAEGYSLTSLPELKGMYVPDEIVPQLEKVARTFFGEENTKYMARLYDKGLGLWKQIALATPGYHFRNFYTDLVSGVFEWGPEFLNPKNWTDAIMLRTGKPITFTDRFGNVVTKTLQDLKGVGTAGTAQTIVESFGAGGIATAKYNPLKYLTRVGGAREDLGRIVGHIIESKAGASDIIAANAVKKVFFDYNELTSFEKNVMKRVIPFYCVDTETEILTKNGWKKYNEVNLDDDVLTINININKAEWNVISGIFIDNYIGEMYSLEQQQISALVTPNHKFPVKKQYKFNNTLRLKETKDLNPSDKIPLSADNINLPKEKFYDDDFIKLIGWVVTEGCYRKRPGYTIEISQSNTYNPKYVLEIENILKRLKVRYHEYNAGIDKKIHYFGITGEYARQIRKLLPDKMLTIEFILSLTKEQIDLLIEILCKADGSYSYTNMVLQTSNKKQADNIQFMLSIGGYASYLSSRANYGNFSNGNISYNITIKYRENAKIVNTKISKVNYTGIIWCPHTQNGTWLARRNGKVYFTGNTWLRKNSVRQFELLAKRTGRFATLAKGINYANIASNLTPEEQANMPEYFKTDAYIKTLLKTKEGLPLFLNPNVGFQDIAKVFNPQDIASSMTPLVKIPAELFAGKEIFSGIPTQTKSFGKQYPIDYTKEAPSFLQFLSKFNKALLNKIGLTKDETGTVKMSDMFAYSLKQIPAFYTAQRMFPNQQQAKTPYNWLSILAGIKFTPLDVTKEKTNKLYQLKNELNSAIDTYNNLNPSTAIPANEDIKKAYKTIALNYIYDKYNMKNVGELQRITDMMGSNKQIDLMLALAKKPYNKEKENISDMAMEGVIGYLQSLGINPSKQDIRTIITSNLNNPPNTGWSLP